MNKILNYNEIEDGTYKRSIFLFYQKLIKLLPDYVAEQPINIIQHTSFMEVVFDMTAQHLLENFVSDMEEKLHTNVLYSSKENEGEIYKNVSYSYPMEDEMFIVYLSSTNYGIVNSLTVFFFDSLETMYSQIVKERTRIPKLKKDVLEEENYSKTLSHFI